MLRHGDKLNLKKPIRRGKVKPLRAVPCQETSDTRQEDKEHKAANSIY